MTPLQKTGMALGGGLVVLALVADPLGLSAAGFSRGQAMILVVGAAIIGVALLGRRTPGVYRSSAVLLLNTLFTLVAVEIAAGVILNLSTNQGATEDYPTYTQQLYGVADPYYAAQTWGTAYLDEVQRSNDFDYLPYVVWRRQPFAGETINIDATARRVTPGAQCTSDAYTVFAFGGSTMWGTGAPDWGTIPAYLQASLAEKHAGAVCVINFGESAWVSDQSLVALVLELKAGNIPDYVLFYDGINDIFAAYQSGRAKVHQNMTSFQEVFDPTNQPSSADLLLEAFEQSTYTARLMDRWFGTFHNRDAPITYLTLGAETTELAAAVFDNYRQNYDFVGDLARLYGFEYAFFWQPILVMGDKPLTEYEQALKDSEPADLIDLTAATYRLAATAAGNDLPRLHYLADVLDDDAAQRWVDPRHLTPEGNQQVAAAMVAIID